ncbi:hypothetical protein [Rhizobium leguminosarum]|uniref:hypothetical protein n=1 Tax=Rhizobium leguminosarum TaxID=384 RepID=UPI0011AEC171|nr:hypothetical protein [Rhizobium leguminosarum]
MTDEQKQRLSAYISAKDGLIKAMTDALKGRIDDGKNFNVSSTILRLSILGMLIFLVQILIQLYRYNSRLITFYSSRRDAIMLSDGDEKTMRLFSQLLLPSGLDFGREPHHPFAEAAELIREGAANLRKRSVGRSTKKTSPKEEPANADDSQ